MDSKDLKLDRRNILPGYESGRYEYTRQYDHSEFSKLSGGDPVRRDNRVNIKVSGQDMEQLHRLALKEGLPLQSLLAHIIREYVREQLQDSQASPLHHDTGHHETGMLVERKHTD